MDAVEGRWSRVARALAALMLALSACVQGNEGGEVASYAEALDVVLEDTGALDVHSTTLPDGTPIRGEGIVLALWEPGIPYAHPDFASRMTIVEDPATGSATVDIRKHATMVAGTLVGDGSGTAVGGGDPAATGFAPEAALVAVEAYDDANDGVLARIEELLLGGYASPAGPPIDAANFSYGDGSIDCAAPYEASAALWDTVVADTDAVLVRSAGNSGRAGLELGSWSVVGYPSWLYGSTCGGGWQTLVAEAIAKNVITVGSTYRLGTRPNMWVCNQPVTNLNDCTDGQQAYFTWPFEGPNQVGDRLLAYDSSRGPTEDGRIKPDLVGQGSAMRHVTADGSSYSGFGQTSFAAPQVTGIAGLLIQKYLGVLGARPSASMVRAILLHSAEDLGLVGPDYYYGWGAVDALAAVQLVDEEAANEGTRLENVTLAPGAQRDYPFFVDERPTPEYGPARAAGESGVLRITAAWTDPAAAPGAAHTLVNDIDISLIDPTGAVIYPWVMPYAESCQSPEGCDPALIPEPASSGQNATDNVEQIVFALPDTVHGVYTLRVRHRAGPSSQTVSLVSNHDVFLPAPEAQWELCGAPCAASDGCCSIAELGTAVSCNVSVCTLTASQPLGTTMTLRVQGHSEAGLYLVEGYQYARPSGAPAWTPLQFYYRTWTPQALGAEAQDGAASSAYTFSVAGTYRFGGRVRSRVSAYVIGTQAFPQQLVVNVAP